MMLVLSVVFGLVPLAGIAWTVAERNDHHRGRSFHEPHHAGAFRHTFFERIHGSAQEVCAQESAPGAEIELTWSPRLQPFRRTPLPPRGLMLPAFTLWWRELVRFYRQRARVVGVIASPLLFWVVIGSGFGSSFRSGDAAGQQHYLDYFYPGALIMIVLFTSIFTMMSVIEDRKEGFPAVGAGGAGAAFRDCAGQSAGRNHALGDSGPDLSRFRSPGRNPSRPGQFSAGGADRLSGLLCAHRAGIHHRLVHGFDARPSTPSLTCSSSRCGCSRERYFR